MTDINSDIATKSSKTVFNTDGSITVTSDNSTKTTVFESNGDIVSTMEVHDEGGLYFDKNCRTCRIQSGRFY